MVSPMELRLSLLLLLVAAGPVAVALDPQTAVQRARDYTTKLGMPFDAAQAVAMPPKAADRPPRWTVMSGETMVLLHVDGKLLMASDLSLMTRARSEPAAASPAIANDAAAWQMAEKALNVLGRPANLVRDAVRANRPASTGGRLMTVSFDTSSNALRGRGNGNRAIFTLDRSTGRIAMIEMVHYWKIGTSSATVSEVVARNLAAGLLGEAASALSSTLGLFEPNGGWNSAEGAALGAKFELRAAYEFRSKRGSVLVDAVTGRVIGGAQFARRR
jgi:hypothetical protein